jgi:hypothetical protein
MVSYLQEKDQWYQQYAKLDTIGKFKMYMNLLEQSPVEDELIKDDFGAIAVELKSELINEKMYEDTIHLIEKTKDSTLKFYQKEFPYLSNFAVEYYIFKEDWEKAKVHLQSFIDDPDQGFDLFIPLYNTLRFYNKSDLALSIAHDMYKPVKDSSELMSGSELDFQIVIFYQLFQGHYTALKNGQDIDFSSTKEILLKYGYGDTFFEVELSTIHQVLKKLSENGNPIYNREEWKSVLKVDQQSAKRNLFWSFAVYMLKEGNFPFSVSYDIWHTFFEVLQRKKSYTDFSFQRQDLDTVLSDYLGFLSNREEVGVLLLWGIPYIYDFLAAQQLVETETKEQSLLHVKAVKKLFIGGRFQEELWRFDFVHAWSKPTSVTEAEFTEEQKVFRQSFHERKEKENTLAKKVENPFEQLSIFDDLFDNPISSSAPKKSKLDQKKKRKAAKNQRKRNRKK